MLLDVLLPEQDTREGAMYSGNKMYTAMFPPPHFTWIFSHRRISIGVTYSGKRTLLLHAFTACCCSLLVFLDVARLAAAADAAGKHLNVQLMLLTVLPELPLLCANAAAVPAQTIAAAAALNTARACCLLTLSEPEAASCCCCCPSLPLIDACCCMLTLLLPGIRARSEHVVAVKGD